MVSDKLVGTNEHGDKSSPIATEGRESREGRPPSDYLEIKTRRFSNKARKSPVNTDANSRWTSRLL